MKKSFIYTLFVLMVMIPFVAKDASAASFSLNIVDSFPIYQGQNNMFAVGYNPITGTGRDLTAVSDEWGHGFGTISAPDGAPYVVRDYETYDWISAQASTTEWAVLAWNGSNNNGHYRVTGAFRSDPYDLPVNVAVGVRDNTTGDVYPFWYQENLYGTMMNYEIFAHIFGDQSIFFAVMPGTPAAQSGGEFSPIYFAQFTGNIQQMEEFPPNPVPVPPSLLLLAPGLAGLIVARRRFRK